MGAKRVRKGGGKLKGGEFEREICKKLSLWVSHGKNEDVFWRSAMSGGRSTVAHAKGKRLAQQAGDISCIHPVGHYFTEKYYLECKDYKDLNIEGVIKGKGHLVQFWCETVVQARNYNKEPMLVAHQNRYPTLLCTSEKGAWYLKHNDWVLWAPRLDLWISILEDVLKAPYALKGDPGLVVNNG